MAIPSLVLDYANALDAAIGPAHSLTPGEVERAAGPVAQVIERIESERAAGKHRYRDLPAERAMVDDVLAAVRRHQGVENLVVLGIGMAMVQTPAAAGATSAPAGAYGAAVGLFSMVRFSGSATAAAWVALIYPTGSMLLLFGG